MNNFSFDINPETISRALIPLITSPPIILCIGSDRITGDSLGPLTGHLLTRKHNVASFVYGTLEHPVTARNILETVSFIKARHCCKKILAVDAALGNDTDVGVIKIIRGGVEPGSALNRNLPKVGDYSITAVVAGFTCTENVLLQDIRLHLVYSLAEAIAAGIAGAVGTVSDKLSYA